MNELAPKVDDARLRIIHAFVADVPHVRALGLGYRAHGDDWAELDLPYAAKLIVADGVIASGAVFSLMDSAAGLAVFCRLGTLLPQATLDLRLDYLRGPEPGMAIVARAECYRVTRHVAFVRGIAHQGDPAHPVANMAGTFVHGSAT